MFIRQAEYYACGNRQAVAERDQLAARQLLERLILFNLVEQ